jgi:hypothetical protein
MRNYVVIAVHGEPGKHYTEKVYKKKARSPTHVVQLLIKEFDWCADIQAIGFERKVHGVTAFACQHVSGWVIPK